MPNRAVNVKMRNFLMFPPWVLIEVLPLRVGCWGALNVTWRSPAANGELKKVRHAPAARTGLETCRTGRDTGQESCATGAGTGRVGGVTRCAWIRICRRRLLPLERPQGGRLERGMGSRTRSPCLRGSRRLQIRG